MTRIAKAGKRIAAHVANARRRRTPISGRCEAAHRRRARDLPGRYPDHEGPPGNTAIVRTLKIRARTAAHLERGDRISPQEVPMAKYLIQTSYTEKGLEGLMKEGGTARRTAVEQAIKGIGGKLEAMYFAFGEFDVCVIMEAPDNVAVTALALAVNQTGGAHTRTTPLITPEEVDQAVKKNVAYRAPGN
jgi:uncharacterized protein with GYD domain